MTDVIRRKPRREDEDTAVKVLEVLVEQATALAKEAKAIAISAKTHSCAKESDLTHLQQAITESKEAVTKLSDTNIKVVEELGRWKWFRVLIAPLAITVLTTAAGAFASFTYLKNDVEEAKKDRAATSQELKAVTNTQRTLVVATKKSEEATAQSERNMKSISDKLDEIAENTKDDGSNRRRR